MSDGKDDLDGLLRGLGETAPFPIDWTAYERSVLARLARAQAAERRRFTWKLALAALTGAAAMVMLRTAFAPAVNSFPPVPSTLTIVPPAPAPKEKSDEPVRPEPKTPTRIVDTDASLKPFAKRIRLPGGAVAQIQFDGYSEPGHSGPSYFIARSLKSMTR